MADTSLLDRLEGIDARFAEVATLITDPAVIADMKRYVRLNKEYHDLERMCAATRRYRKLLSDVAEAKSLLASENDPDIRQMAHDQLSEAEAALPGLEEEIKIMLIPADPEDAKNAIVEIRGGTVSGPYLSDQNVCGSDAGTEGRKNRCGDDRRRGWCLRGKHREAAYAV